MFSHKTMARAPLPLGCVPTRDGIALEPVLVPLWGMRCSAAVVSEVVTQGASAGSLSSGCCGNKLKSKNPAAPTSCTHPIGRKMLAAPHAPPNPSTAPLVQPAHGGSVKSLLPQLCHCQTSLLAPSGATAVAGPWGPVECCPAALGGKAPACLLLLSILSWASHLPQQQLTVWWVLLEGCPFLRASCMILGPNPG